MAASTLVCCGGGLPRSVGACVVRQWNNCCWQSMAGVSKFLMCRLGWMSGASGLCGWLKSVCCCQCSVNGVSLVNLDSASFHRISVHHKRGLDITMPSAASIKAGGDPHCWEM